MQNTQEILDTTRLLLRSLWEQVRMERDGG